MAVAAASPDKPSMETQEEAEIIRKPAVITTAGTSNVNATYGLTKRPDALSCRAVLLGFPSLAGQEHGARNGPLTTRVVGDLTP